ncbi:MULTISPECIES: TldD/PmbA family protein [unclassified Meiothermus]|uniref:TldD/PmbA family protein n=1 Tax=unclassified Meiothermus TaxID=370471 RepID=UPI000D7C02A5|nr:MULTISPECIES: TldD/PmbA family protein [unclassified Meiothermus]PZA06614.1 TldD/PmbA family protein [Meiothermus sp. Pnk-1]RYM37718.1 TldD/PmbA family protein [Meiothermus sp. PNK-Is4]
MNFEEAKDYLLQKARQIGLEAEVLATETREMSLSAFEGRLEEITQATQGGLGVRVVVEGKVGYAYTEEKTPEALDWAMQEAYENALLQAGGEAFIPAGQALGQHDLLGEGLSAPLEKKQAAALAVEATLRQDARVKQVPRTAYREQEVEVVLGSTQGASGGYRTGVSVLMGSAILERGGAPKQSWNVDVSREFHALEPGKTALELIERTARLLGARPLKTGKYRAYFEPKAFAQLLGVISFLFSAKNVLEGKSLLADRVGERVASGLVTIVDDPTLPGGIASRPFDAEGTPSRPLVIIEQGVLKGFAHNSETARKMGVESTGHAQRGYKGVLGVGYSNLFLKPGSGVRLEEGVLVTEMMGLHAGANPISGDFSLQALGLKLEGGEVAYAVENFTVAGNLLTLLQSISAVGGELEWEYWGMALGAPMVEVAELSFAGA